MMKYILSTIALCLCAVLGAQAQINGGNWYDGEIVYSASQKADGKVRMYAMDEGEELEFWLLPIADKKDTYRITRDPNSQDYEYHDVVKVRHLKEKGLDVLCFYTKKNELKTVMSNEKEWDADKINQKKWLKQFSGDYVTEEESEFEKRINWAGFEFSVNDIVLPLQVITFNGRIIDLIEMEEVEDEATNELAGIWKLVLTADGFDLYEMNRNANNYPWEWDKNAVRYHFTKTNLEKGRFPYTSHVLLNDKQFRKYDKKMLRIMRNEILARHGYHFQSKDLQEYFGKQPWYHPASSNDQVELSLLEQLNVELIKYVENSK